MQAHSLHLLVEETSWHIAVSTAQRVSLADHCVLVFKRGGLETVELNDDSAPLASFRMHEVADVFHGYPSLKLDTIVLMCNISRCSAQPPLLQRATQASSPSLADFSARAAIYSARPTSPPRMA
jgi:hypothetical protein